jgi:hypothetical protein
MRVANVASGFSTGPRSDWLVRDAYAQPHHRSMCHSVRASAGQKSLRMGTIASKRVLLDLRPQRGRTRCQCRQIDRQQASLAHHESAADHHIGHAGAVLAHDHLGDRCVQRDQRRRIQVEKHKIGGVARSDPPDLLEPERPRAVSATIVENTRVGLPGAGAARRCVLSPNVMSRWQSDGRGRRLSRPPIYRVHWSGGRTDSGPGDCGTTADLVLEYTDLMRLANVAGGFSSGLRLIGP